MVSFSRPSQWLYLSGTCGELGHSWHPSCVYSTSEVFFFVFVGAIKVYLPLFVVSNLSRVRDWRWLLTQMIPNVLQSSLFLAINAGGFVGFLCLLRHLIGRFYLYSSAFLPGFLASLCAILCERKSRRGLLTGYVSTLAAEIVFSLLKSRGLVRALPYGEVVLFCFASAVLLHRERTSKLPHQDAIGTVLRKLIYPSLPLLPVNRASTVGCVADIAVVTVWSFGCGYLLQTALSLLTHWKMILKKKYKVKDLVFKKYSVQFGLFFASLAVGFKLSNRVLSLLGIPRDLRLLLAGMLAGLSMIFIKSSTLSLYATGKAIEVLYFKAVDRGFARPWYYGDVLLYAICTAIIFHGTCFEAHHVREAYHKFLIKVTRGRLLHINYKAMDCFGTDASKTPTEYQQQSHADN